MTDINYHGPVVAFDLDDTLFRERDFCRSGFHRLLQREGMEYLYEEMDRRLTMRQNPFDAFIREKMIKNGLDREPDIAEEITFYRNHLPEKLLPVPGTIMMLEMLKERGIIAGIITDGRSVTQRNKIKALGLESFIHPDNILISEETGHGKSEKFNFARLMRSYPEASRFYYVGDNVQKDFIMPNLMGWTTVKVPYNPDNVHPEEAAPSSDYVPQIVLNDISELTDIIN